ncbi:MAG: ABC transporter permease [Clostridiales bacterium]|nr:ABC transporter permease [Clostridiales bacterium]
MKLWNNYLKELKIASRGFYFYMEFVMAAILLVCILLFVPAEIINVSQEAIYVDMPRETLDAMLQQSFGETGRYERAEDTKVKLSPADIVYYDEQTGEKFEMSFSDKKTLELETWYYYNAATGAHEKTLYITESMDDLVRVAKAEKWYSTVVQAGENGQMQYKLLLFGSESERYQNLISAVMDTENLPALTQAADDLEVVALGTENVLNNRESYMPLAIVIMNGLMGMLVVIAYLTIDKSSGLIRAMSLTPMHTRSYLLSKVMVVLTTSLISSLIITVPVMGVQPNYLLFVLVVLLVAALSCMLGLWIASFFSDLKSAFGVLILFMVILMFPALTYIIPSFSPLWIRLMPTYPMLQAVKETLLPSPDTGYVLLACGGMIVVSALFLWWSEHRYKKSLGV